MSQDNMPQDISDHSLLISIHGTLNQFIGRMEGHAEKVDSLDQRQNNFEQHCSIKRSETDKKIDILEKKMNEWTGVAKIFALVFGPGTILSIILSLSKIVHF